MTARPERSAAKSKGSPSTSALRAYAQGERLHMRRTRKSGRRGTDAIPYIASSRDRDIYLPPLFNENPPIPAISFEFFPPNTDEQQAQLVRAAARLKTHKPEYASVTFGAGGSTLSCS